MSVFRIEILPRTTADRLSGGDQVVAALRGAGLTGVKTVVTSRLFFIEGNLAAPDAETVARNLLVDPVIDTATVLAEQDAVAAPVDGNVALEVHPRPGVMDPVAESTLAELRAEGYDVQIVRTARRYVVAGDIRPTEVLDAVGRVLANDCIEHIVPGTAGVQPAARPPACKFELRRVPICDLDDHALERLSRDAHLFLSLAEMRTIQDHFRTSGREPTDLELETLAQTWSEHCVHKTLRSAIVYHGAPLPNAGQESADPGATAEETRHYGNLLKDTIARATAELIETGQGPTCLSVFKDNAGVIAFDGQFGIAFKVETHNHPAAIEPYGGAATGIGGVIRDVIGCGLGAKPIANTDVFCVAPSDWPHARLPKGVLHPLRVLRGIVGGVADYGNRMGIPTVNGAVYLDPRYLGNPLVYCGSVGLIPRDRIEKAARPGDLVVVIGGRTGRDGIHGATFSSAELTDTHADEFSHAVQIGNAITEKRFLDAILQARDANGGCLYTAITDCGAGGLSSAVGEMGELIGATVDLDKVPLKYLGLRYDEIWISEAQERMVVAVSPDRLDPFLQIMADEEVEATVIGEFGHTEPTDAASPDRGAARIVLRYDGHIVGDLDMEFLHHGVPQLERVAEWWPADLQDADTTTPASRAADPDRVLDRLVEELARPNVAAKEWIIRQYDHEVQGGSAAKPLLGPGRGPGDAAVVRPRLDSWRGLAIGCGLAPHLADRDPYWMAAASIDEAVRNVVCAGGDPHQAAVLDNFCWGRSDDPEQLGGLVRACQACYDVSKAFGIPFISGKDSLNNEFALDEADVGPLLDTLRERAAGDGLEAQRLRALLPSIEARVRDRQRLVIPSTLLISAIAIVEDVRHGVTPDLKSIGNDVLLVGGLPQMNFALATAAAVHDAVAELIRQGLAVACHDVADGGWLVSVAEMALAGGCGVRLAEPIDTGIGPYEELCAGYVIETPDAEAVSQLLSTRGLPYVMIATTTAERTIRAGKRDVPLRAIQTAWSGREEA